MKSIFMRVLLCKIHCSSFICFCKPSAAAHIYNPGPFKLENSPHVPPTSSHKSDENHTSHCVEEAIEIKSEESLEDGKQEAAEKTVVRSCLKNKGKLGRKKVQWMDNLGKELVNIREFESSETGDTDNEEEGRACLCTIL